MAMQITLSDEDYSTLAAVAAQRGAPIETLVHEAISARYPAPVKQKGSYPNGKPLSPAMRAENERIARSLSSASPWASDMVIEDRGPR